MKKLFSFLILVSLTLSSYETFAHCSCSEKYSKTVTIVVGIKTITYTYDYCWDNSVIIRSISVTTPNTPNPYWENVLQYIAQDIKSSGLSPQEMDIPATCFTWNRQVPNCDGCALITWDLRLCDIGCCVKNFESVVDGTYGNILDPSQQSGRHCHDSNCTHFCYN